LLLDELIDARSFEELPNRAQFQEDLAARLRTAHLDDPERQVEALLEFQRVQRFRIAVADLTGRLPLMKVSDRLTDLAEIIVQQALAWAWAQVIEKFGAPECGATQTELRPAGVVVVAYGKLGGIELGYSSDLDLVFLHDSQGDVQQTHGTQSIDNATFFARLGQRLVHLLTMHSRAGRLYEVDIRLRPSGKGGLLVQSMRHFEEYQLKEAWTWEHQALLRARAVAGAQSLQRQFEALRLDLLRTAVRRDSLREEVRKMRERMRNELSKAKTGQFDLKQDAGGIADVEFLVQYWVLFWAEKHPEVAYYSDNIRQLESLASGALVSQEDVDFLTSTYRLYRERMHHRALDGASDLISSDDFLDERRRVIAIWNEVMGG
jgi:glutamate-ammonia-ligase adenylyltransferase